MELENLTEEEIQEINRLFTPRIVDEYFTTTPTPVQQIALCVTSRELLFGGAVGGGKSEFAIMSALQYVDVPGYSCLILRRTWPDLISSGAILDRFNERMAPFVQQKKVKKRDGGRQWVFPSGAKIQFGYVNRPAMKTKFQGAEFQKIIFDEVTLFEPEIYEYLLSRCRKPRIPCAVCTTTLIGYSKDGQIVYRHEKNAKNGKRWCTTPIPDPVIVSRYGPAPDGLTVFDIPTQIISTANPGGPGHLYFKERFIVDNPKKLKDGVFIPSTMLDNPFLNREEYLKNLENLGPVERAQMIEGDWDAEYEGKLFNRGDFEFVDRLPKDSEVREKVRFWDLAASDGKNADYTVGALVSATHDGRFFLEDLIRVQYLPPQVEELMRNTAKQDGIDVKIRCEQEPGSSGKSLISHLQRRILAGYQFRGVRSTGSKTARAGALVSQVAAGNFFVKNADWNRDMLDEFVLFDNGLHDDQVDAVAGALNALTGDKRPVRLIV